MKVKNLFERDRLNKARMQLFCDYAYSILCTVVFSFAVLLISVSLSQRTMMTDVVLHLIPIMLGISTTVCFATVTSIMRNWTQNKTELEAKRKIKAFKKNFAYLVRSEYGYVTEENVESVRKIATILYANSTGDTMYNKMYYQSPEFFNKMILSKAEFLALYGRVPFWGGRKISVI